MSKFKNSIYSSNGKFKFIGVIAAVFIIIIAIFVSPLKPANASVIKSNEGSYCFYTSHSTSAEIPLDEPADNENLAIFTKDENDIFTLSEFRAMNDGDSNIILNGTYMQYIENRYYILITDKPESELTPYSGKTGQVNDNTVIIDGNGNNTISLQIIDVIYDNEGPQITNVDAGDGTWCQNLNVVVTATDPQGGCGLNEQAYSFDGGTTWQASNTINIDNNQTLNIKVRDALGQESIAFEKVINNVDSEKPVAQGIIKTPNILSGLYSNYTTITINGAQDTISGLAENAYKFGEEGQWQTSPEYISYDTDDFTIYIRDNAGNINSYPVDLVNNDNKAPEIIINSNTISDDWQKGSSSFEITIVDDKSGINAGSLSGAVANGTVSFALKEENTYIATVVADENCNINSEVTISVNDNVGNNTTAGTDIKIDNTNPVITIVEDSIKDIWSGQETEFNILVQDTGSFVDINSIAATISNGTVMIESTTTQDLYKATVTANENAVVDDCINIQASDNVGNSASSTSSKNIKADNQKIVISDTSIQKVTGSADKSVIKDGDTVRVRFQLSDGSGSGVNNNSVNVNLNGSIKAAISEGDYYYADFVMGTDITVSENDFLEVKSISFSDNAGNASVEYENTITDIKYYAPIHIFNLKMESNNADSENEVARDGDVISVTFSTNHPVLMTETQIAGKDISFTSNDGINWSGSYTVENNNIVDNEFFPLVIKIDDSAGNPQTLYTQTDTVTEKIKYYAPIVISDIAITTTNQNDSTKYAKDGDVVTVIFKTNHEVNLSNVSIAGKEAKAISSKDGTCAQKWSLTYKINNGDVTDLSNISFNFTASDIAGNDAVTKTNFSLDVTNSIKYFAPVTANTIVTSNYRNTDYAKNGDIITLTSKANHPVSIVFSDIMGRNTLNNGNNTTELTMSYQIPMNETVLSEGNVTFNYTLADLAGNSFPVNSNSITYSNKITYDRTSPSIKILSNTVTFSATTVTYNVLFSDLNLSSQDLSLTVNGNEYITAADKSSVTGTEYIKPVTIDLDGDYTIVATMLDKAGNKVNSDVITRVTVDTRNPEIKGVMVELDKPSVYKASFKISDYFKFIEDNINQVICTITNNEGTFDWDVDTPITTEGKNTITLILTDMAGNISNTITYDFYIDATTPKPIVKEEISGKILNNGNEENTFTSEMKLKVSLEELNIEGVSGPDKFTTLEILDDEGNMVLDLLKNPQDKEGVYYASLKKYGKYTLVAEAIDDVGNETGQIKYNFNFKDLSLWKKYVNSTPLIAITIILLAVIISGAVALSISHRKKNYAK